MLTPQQKLTNRRWLRSRERLSKLPPPLLPYNVTRLMEYPETWTRDLRTAIRQRDNYTCQVCQRHYGVRNAINTVVHHINCDKTDCSWSNLVTLCKWCHKRTMRNRFYWYSHLYRFMRSKDTQWAKTHYVYLELVI